MAPRVALTPRDPAHSQQPTEEATVDTISIRTDSPEVLPENPKLAVCSGCRGEYPKKDLITVHEGRHDNLHFFNGDRICKSCARANGVEF